MDHDFYWGFPHFWWLIFPLFWMIFALAWGWSRHSRANRALDIIKTYADQGKEPPPELLKNLRCGTDGYRGYSPERRLHRAALRERLFSNKSGSRYVLPQEYRAQCGTDCLDP